MELPWCWDFYYKQSLIVRHLMPPVFCIMSPLCFSIIVANRYLLFCYCNFILKTDHCPCVTLAVVYSYIAIVIGHLSTTVPNVGP